MYTGAGLSRGAGSMRPVCTLGTLTPVCTLRTLLSTHAPHSTEATQRHLAFDACTTCRSNSLALRPCPLCAPPGCTQAVSACRASACRGLDAANSHHIKLDAATAITSKPPGRHRQKDNAAAAEARGSWRGTSWRGESCSPCDWGSKAS